MEKASIIPFLLAGGSGTRLWPLSRRDRPKQFVSLRGAQTLFQDTLDRMVGDGFASPIVLAHADHRFQVAAQLAENHRGDARIVLEPIARDTAAAACIATLIAAERDPASLVLLAPCDHVYGDDAVFRNAILSGVAAAREGSFVVLGVKPTKPHTGYGYVEIEIGGAGPIHRVRRFVEKPPASIATAYLAKGNYFWNAGVFLFQASTALDAFAKLQPAILAACRGALVEAATDADFIRLAPARYAESPKISFDYAIMEKAGPIACAPLDTFWSDCGSWSSLWEIARHDADGNATRGDVMLLDTTNTLAQSDGRLLVLYGLDRVVAVATEDATLVASLDRADDLKDLIAALEAAGRKETSAFPTPRGLRPGETEST